VCAAEVFRMPLLPHGICRGPFDWQRTFRANGVLHLNALHTVRVPSKETVVVLELHPTAITCEAGDMVCSLAIEELYHVGLFRDFPFTFRTLVLSSSSDTSAFRNRVMGHRLCGFHKMMIVNFGRLRFSIRGGFFFVIFANHNRTS